MERTPACPTPEHRHRRFTRHGQYGVAGHMRPRFMCADPLTGDHHTFTEILPREVAAAGQCRDCDRPLASHQGAASPRGFFYPVREIARALYSVAGGTSYSRAGMEARMESGRQWRDPAGRLRTSRHGEIVADWVEVFAPIITAAESRLPTEWPDVLLLDELPFVLKGNGDDPKQHAFSILAAAGIRDGEAIVWRLHAVPRANENTWSAFLRSLGGRPRLVVADGATAIKTGVELAWPIDTPDLYACEWHLGRSINKRFRDDGLALKDTPLGAARATAFTDEGTWRDFVREAGKVNAPWLHEWIRDNQAVVDHSFDLRAPDAPKSAASLEGYLHELKTWLHKRRKFFLNQERLNRLLSLMAIRLNGWGSEARFSNAIRTSLTDVGGSRRSNARSSVRAISSRFDPFALASAIVRRS